MGSVERKASIVRAKQLGLSFYVKQWGLYPYRTDAMKHACDQDKSCKFNLDNEVPNVSVCILTDSGVDGMEYLPKAFIDNNRWYEKETISVFFGGQHPHIWLNGV